MPHRVFDPLRGFTLDKLVAPFHCIVAIWPHLHNAKRQSICTKKAAQKAERFELFSPHAADLRLSFIIAKQTAIIVIKPPR